MSDASTPRPIQLIRRSSTLATWGGRGALLIAAINIAILAYHHWFTPIPDGVLATLGAITLLAVVTLMVFFSRHVRTGIQSPRPVDMAKSMANDVFAFTGWISIASAAMSAVVMTIIGLS